MDNPQIPVPTAPLPVQPALSSSKLPLIFIGLLLILSAGVGGIFLGKYLYAPKTPVAPAEKTTTVLTVTPTIDPTANWKTYTELGFTIKYPHSWFELTPPYKDSTRMLSNYPNWKPSNQPDEIRLGSSVYEKSSSQCFDGIENNCQKTFDEMLSLAPNAEIPSNRGEARKVSNLTIAGEPAVKVTIKISSDAFNVRYDTKRGNYYYFINFWNQNKENADKNDQLFDQILSTFQFLK